MRRQLRLARALTLAGVAVLAFAVSGCAQVKIYEMGTLAHPTMARGSIATMGEGHLHAISEGAIETADGAGSGCGCN